MRTFLTALILTLSATFATSQDVCNMGGSAAADACGMQKAFAGSLVTPQVIGTFSPKAALYVQYQNIVVGGAQQLAPPRVSSKPLLRMAFVNGPQTALGQQALSKNYIVLLVDYQAQSRTTKVAWLQAGFRVDPRTGSMSSGVAPIIPYKAPNPAKGSGVHEYVFLVFEGSETELWAFIKRNPIIKAQLSGSFALSAFLDRSNLRKAMVAGSFFKTSRP